jgi:hypothetical protein
VTAAVLAYEKRAKEIGVVAAELAEVQYLLGTPGYWKLFTAKERKRGKAIHRRLETAAVVWLDTTKKLYRKLEEQIE